jgi:ParB-like chromosome segregation protein Spo0J
MGKRTTRERVAAEGRSEAGTQAAAGELKAHPYAEQFQLMEGAEYERFKRDLGRNGLIDPITVHDGVILDGRNRYRACRELGIEPRTVPWSGPGSILAFVLSRNVHRRGLRKSQSAMSAAGLASLGRGRPRKNSSIERISQAEAAEAVGVSLAQVKRAATVLACGDPALADMVRRGRASVGAAADVAAMPAAERAALVARGPEAIKNRRQDAGGAPPAEPTPRSEADAPRARSEVVADSAPAAAPADEPASETAAPAERAFEAVTPTADGRRDPGRYPLRERLADPTTFDIELARYRENADSLASRGGAPAGEAYMRINAAATSSQQAIVSIRLDLLPPPEEWSLCQSCRGSGTETWLTPPFPGVCLTCGGAGFLNFPGLGQALKIAEARQLSSGVADPAVGGNGRRAPRRR